MQLSSNIRAHFSCKHGCVWDLSWALGVQAIDEFQFPEDLNLNHQGYIKL